MKTTIAALLKDLHNIPINAALRANDRVAYARLTGNPSYVAFCSAQNLLLKTAHGHYVPFQDAHNRGRRI